MYKACRLVGDDRRDYFGPGRWLRSGSEYRVLVEPLDIANWWVATCFSILSCFPAMGAGFLSSASRQPPATL